MPVQLRVRLDDDGAVAALQALARRAQDLEPAMDDIGRMLRTSARQRIQAAEAPDGSSWPPLSAATRRRRGESAKPLQDKRHLFQSLTWRASASEAVVGSNRRYARIQQLGGEAGRGLKVKIPARPYLGVSDADRGEIGAILLDHVGA